MGFLVINGAALVSADLRKSESDYITFSTNKYDQLLEYDAALLTCTLSLSAIWRSVMLTWTLSLWAIWRSVTNLDVIIVSNMT